MHTVAGTVAVMDRPTLDSLLDTCEQGGLRVLRAALPGDLDGGYILRARLIVLDRDLAAWEAVPALMHEMAHWRRGDDGHQGQCVEDHIDEDVAEQLIDPTEYALAEARYGWHTGGIAVDLDLPRWVVQAYRRVLERAA